MDKSKAIAERKKIVKRFGRKCHNCKTLHLFNIGTTNANDHFVWVWCKCGVKYRGDGKAP